MTVNLDSVPCASTAVSVDREPLHDFETVELSVPAKSCLRQVHLSKRTRRPVIEA